MDNHAQRSSFTRLRYSITFCISGGSTAAVQWPKSINDRKKKNRENRQGEGAPSYEAGPPTSPGSRTPPHLQEEETG